MCEDGAFSKLRIRGYWCSGSQGWKSVKCVPVTVSWELKDCILPLDSPYSYPLRAGGSGERWARSLWRLRVCLYSSELKLSCSGEWPLHCFPCRQNEEPPPTSTQSNNYWAPTMSQAHPSNQSYAAPYLLHHQILMELLLVTQNPVGLYNEKCKCGLQLWLLWESRPRGTGCALKEEGGEKMHRGLPGALETWGTSGSAELESWWWLPSSLPPCRLRFSPLFLHFPGGAQAPLERGRSEAPQRPSGPKTTCWLSARQWPFLCSYNFAYCCPTFTSPSLGPYTTSVGIIPIWQVRKLRQKPYSRSPIVGAPTFCLYYSHTEMIFVRI